jgi:hypothetical protein
VDVEENGVGGSRRCVHWCWGGRCLVHGHIVKKKVIIGSAVRYKHHSHGMKTISQLLVAVDDSRGALVGN